MFLLMLSLILCLCMTESDLIYQVWLYVIWCVLWVPGSLIIWSVGKGGSRVMVDDVVTPRLWCNMLTEASRKQAPRCYRTTRRRHAMRKYCSAIFACVTYRYILYMYTCKYIPVCNSGTYTYTCKFPSIPWSWSIEEVPSCVATGSPWISTQNMELTCDFNLTISVT